MKNRKKNLPRSKKSTPIPEVGTVSSIQAAFEAAAVSGDVASCAEQLQQHEDALTITSALVVQCLQAQETPGHLEIAWRLCNVLLKRSLVARAQTATDGPYSALATELERALLSQDLEKVLCQLERSTLAMTFQELLLLSQRLVGKAFRDDLENALSVALACQLDNPRILKLRHEMGDTLLTTEMIRESEHTPFESPRTFFEIVVELQAERCFRYLLESDTSSKHSETTKALCYFVNSGAVTELQWCFEHARLQDEILHPLLQCIVRDGKLVCFESFSTYFSIFLQKNRRALYSSLLHSKQLELFVVCLQQCPPENTVALIENCRTLQLPAFEQCLQETLVPSLEVAQASSITPDVSEPTLLLDEAQLFTEDTKSFQQALSSSCFELIDPSSVNTPVPQFSRPTMAAVPIADIQTLSSASQSPRSVPLMHREKTSFSDETALEVLNEVPISSADSEFGFHALRSLISQKKILPTHLQFAFIRELILNRQSLALKYVLDELKTDISAYLADVFYLAVESRSLETLETIYEYARATSNTTLTLYTAQNNSLVPSAASIDVFYEKLFSELEELPCLTDEQYQFIRYCQRGDAHLIRSAVSRNPQYTQLQVQLSSQHLYFLIATQRRLANISLEAFYASPLSFACQSGKLDAVRVLTSAGLKIATLGETEMSAAIAAGLQEIQNLLLVFKAACFSDALAVGRLVDFAALHQQPIETDLRLLKRTLQ